MGAEGRGGAWRGEEGGIIINSSQSNFMSHTKSNRENQKSLSCKTPKQAYHAPISYEEGLGGAGQSKIRVRVLL